VIDLYTWATPNGRKVSIALEELGVDYTVHAIDIGKGEQFRSEFVAISPNSKIPAIVERDSGRSMMESGAILWYLAQTYGRLQGADPWQTLQWLMLQMASIGPILGQVHHFSHFNPGKAPYAEERFRTEAIRLYGVLDARLHEHEYLSDTYSIADIAVWPWISRFEWQRIALADYPSLARWYVAIADRAAVQRGYDVPLKTNPIPRPAAAPQR
jgi:GST-like protein